MASEPTLRIARPTDLLAEITEMYLQGLSFVLLGSFDDHDGFDGRILGRPGAPYHLEFTSQKGHTAGSATSQDNLLVFYVPDPTVWTARCAQMTGAGFVAVPALNPYWDRLGRTFEDLDGYRVVLQRADWHAIERADG